jgi:hypothetical protein
MLPRAMFFCLLSALIPVRLAAQTRPATLSTVFEEVVGPNGLVGSSDDIQLDGTNHAAHFNSAFQSDFRLMNVALASQLTTIPVPSPASGFIYKFDSATGTFMRATRSFGPILADRAETIGRDRVAFSFNEQVFSFGWTVCRSAAFRPFSATTTSRPPLADPTSSQRSIPSRPRSGSSLAR